MARKHRITVKEGQPTRVGSVTIDVRAKKLKKGQYRVIVTEKKELHPQIPQICAD